LGGPKIPNRIHDINFGTDLNLNLLLILKGFKPYGENLVNSPKISLDLVFATVNLVGHTCMQNLVVPMQLSKDLV
jgi:hypothetical protein